MKRIINHIAYLFQDPSIMIFICLIWVCFFVLRKIIHVVPAEERHSFSSSRVGEEIFRSGDVILFSNFSALQVAIESRWTHCGIVLNTKGGPYILEITPEFTKPRLTVLHNRVCRILLSKNQICVLKINQHVNDLLMVEVVSKLLERQKYYSYSQALCHFMANKWMFVPCIGNKKGSFCTDLVTDCMVLCGIINEAQKKNLRVPEDLLALETHMAPKPLLL